MISFLYSHSHTHPKHKAEEEEDKEDEEEEDEERETTALFYSYIVLSHLLKQISSSLKSSSVDDSVKARTFFSSVAPKVTYSFVPFSTQNSTTTRTTTITTTNGDEEEDEEESEA